MWQHSVPLAAAVYQAGWLRVRQKQLLHSGGIQFTHLAQMQVSSCAGREGLEESRLERCYGVARQLASELELLPVLSLATLDV